MTVVSLALKSKSKIECVTCVNVIVMSYRG